MSRCLSAFPPHACCSTTSSAFDTPRDPPQSLHASTSSAADRTCGPSSFASVSLCRQAPPCSSSSSQALPRSSPSESPPSCLWRARLNRVLQRAHKRPKVVSPHFATAPLHHLSQIVFVPSTPFLCLTTLQPKTVCLFSSFFCVLSFYPFFNQSQSPSGLPLSLSLLFSAKPLSPWNIYLSTFSLVGSISGCLPLSLYRSPPRHRSFPAPRFSGCPRPQRRRRRPAPHLPVGFGQPVPTAVDRER